MILRGELPKDAKNSNIDHFETALYSKSVSMPLSLLIQGKHFSSQGDNSKCVDL